jgi:hypothetical protein
MGLSPAQVQAASVLVCCHGGQPSRGRVVAGVVREAGDRLLNIHFDIEHRRQGETMSDVISTTAAARWGYRAFDSWKYERILEKAESRQIGLTALENSHHKIAAFTRLLRAIELCSSEEMVDYLAEVMIGGITSGDVEEKPDFVQMALSALATVTKTEMRVMLKMREHRLFEGEEGVDVYQAKNDFIEGCCKELSITPGMLSAIQNGLIRTGLVSVEHSDWDGRAASTNQLTELANYLFHLIEYEHGLA